MGPCANASAVAATKPVAAREIARDCERTNAKAKSSYLLRKESGPDRTNFLRLVVFSLNFPENPLQNTPGDLDETEAAHGIKGAGRRHHSQLKTSL
jgi:hypothetical protein